MPAAPEPPGLAALVDFAERSRHGDWSLRSALVRYAQSQPQRVSEILDQVRRIEFALAPHAKLLGREGPQLWQALGSGDRPATDEGALVVGALAAARSLDELADGFTEWAVDRTGPRPDPDRVDAVVAEVGRQLDALGVAREDPQRRPPRRG